VRRHDLQNEGKREKNPAAPPADPGQKIPSLTNSDERIRRRARAAEACRESATLSALEKNCSDDDQTVDYEQSQKKRVNH
jgi:hypothetical protein